LSLRILLDEDSQAKYLVNLLEIEGHDVLTVNLAGLVNSTDVMVLSYAINNKRVLLTRNCEDFQELHQENPIHSGILAIYQNSDFSKNMTYQMIVMAIRNLETSEYLLENQFVVLNQWIY